MGVFWPLLNGARLVVARPEGRRDAEYLRELIEREHITTLHFVPSMLESFLEVLPKKVAARVCDTWCAVARSLGKRLRGSAWRSLRMRVCHPVRSDGSGDRRELLGVRWRAGSGTDRACGGQHTAVRTG